MKLNFTKRQYFFLLFSSIVLLLISLLALFLNTIFVYSESFEKFSDITNLILKVAFFLVIFQMILTLMHGNFVAETFDFYKGSQFVQTALAKKLKILSRRRNIENTAVIILDLNGLKFINDFFGMEKGDEILFTFSNFIQKAAGNAFFTARFGSDEFICVDENSSKEKIQQFRNELERLVLSYNEKNQIKMSFSIGFEISTAENKFSIHELFHAADMDMYRNKRSAKNKDRRIFGKIDPVTNLYSNECFAQIIEEHISLDSKKRQLAVEFSNFSNFCFSSSLSENPVSNEILKSFANLLGESKNTVCASRLFSDYFVVLLDVSSMTHREIEQYIYLRNKKFKEKVADRYSLCNFSVNSGIYIIQEPSECVAEMVQFANIARNDSLKKENGVCIYSPGFDDFSQKRQEMLSAFKSALEKDEFAVYLQPKISTEDDSINGVEALSRWTFEGAVRWTPDEYIPVLETSGDIILLDYYVYRKIFSWLSMRSRSGQEYINISLNVSPVHLNNPSLFFDYINKLKLQYAVPTEYITFELSETGYMQKKENVALFIKVLHEMGFKISLDDFRYDYFSIGSLENIPFDEIKISHNVKDEDFSFSDRMILKTVIGMIKEMDKVVVCEGIENRSQIDFLKNEKCDLIQGFYYSKPIPLDSYNEFCSNFASV